MARKIPIYQKGHRALYPKGWPANMQATLYLNQKKRKARGPFEGSLLNKLTVNGDPVTVNGDFVTVN